MASDHVPPSVVDRVLSAVDELADEAVDFTRELVRIPTVNPPGEHYEDCARAIGDRLERFDFDVEYLEAEGRPEHTEEHPRVNVVGTLSGARSHPCLHLNGHFDVVPVGEGWTVDPFGGEVEHGRIYGRGTTDMKAGIAAAVATALALVTAYYKGLVDLLTVVVGDSIVSMPRFLLILLLSVLFKEAIHPIATVYDGGILLALVFAATGWPFLWRAVRGPSLQVAEEEWIDAARSYGQRPATTMRKHMSPYIAGYMLVYASLSLGGVIIGVAALSFLGFGIQAPTPEWGRAVNEGRPFIATASWHNATIPGLLIVLVVTAFNALGDGVRDAIDPQSRTDEGAAGATATGGGG
jgi:ABC-type antimicrobial peptide transport system permease subunit